MNKKLSVVTAVLNFFVALAFIAAAAGFLYLLILLTVNFDSLGYAAIAGVLAFPFLGFGVLLFAGGGTAFTVINIKGLLAVKKCDTEKLKFFTLVSTVLAGIVCGLCGLVVVSFVFEALISTAGGNYSLLLYTLIPLTLAAASFVMNLVTLKSIKRGTDNSALTNIEEEKV